MMLKLLKPVSIVFFILLINACKTKTNHLIQIDIAMLDSIKKTSDTVYTKKYRSQEFATATYFVNKKDSVVYQIMKDVNEVIRQVIGSKNNTLLYKAAYFANGQLMQDLKVNAYGKFNGPSIVYYQNGTIKSEGKYSNGLYKGKWKNYNEQGKLILVEEYDDNGQFLKASQ